MDIKDAGEVKEAIKKYDRDERCTYADYVTWDDDQRFELIDGVAYAMSAPTSMHQEICISMSAQLYFFLDGKSCKVFSAPFDVRLNADSGDDTVVQPDIVVVCDRSKLNKAGCKGAPDMLVEIISPSTASRDYGLKYNKYLHAGVREYWIVDPEAQLVRVCILNEGKYDIIDYIEADTIPVRILDGCIIDIKKAFGEVEYDTES